MRENGYMPSDISTAAAGNSECYNLQVMSPEQQHQALNMDPHQQYSSYTSHQVSPYYNTTAVQQLASVNGTSTGYPTNINAAGESAKEISAAGLSIYSAPSDANNEAADGGVHPATSSMHLSEASSGAIHSLAETPTMIDESNMLAANDAAAAQQVAAAQAMQLASDSHYRHPGAGQTTLTEYGGSMVQMDVGKPQQSYVTQTHHIDPSLMEHYNPQRHHPNAAPVDFAHSQLAASGLLTPAYPYDVRSANDFAPTVVGCHDYPSTVGRRDHLNNYKNDLWMGGDKNKIVKKPNDRKYTHLSIPISAYIYTLSIFAIKITISVIIL